MIIWLSTAIQHSIYVGPMCCKVLVCFFYVLYNHNIGTTVMTAIFSSSWPQNRFFIHTWLESLPGLFEPCQFYCSHQSYKCH